MPCPLCGANEDCRCSTPEFQPRHVRQSRFVPDRPSRRFASDELCGADADSETEPSEVSEQQFVASLSSPSEPRRARFVLGGAEEAIGAAASDAPKSDDSIVASPRSSLSEERPQVLDCNSIEEQVASSSNCDLELDEPESALGVAPHACAIPQDNHWREEVAERVHSYRVRRRRRSPRYPSLSLKFESPEPYRAMVSTAEPPAPRISLDAAVPEPAKPAMRSYAAASPAVRPNAEPKIIEFPKPVPPPLPILDVPMVEELAEPIVEGPRILDAPEVAPQAPPLGGITLESPVETVPALELPLQVASVGSRMAAAVLDGFFVILATVLFAAIAFKITPGMSARTLAGVTLGVSAVLWAVYHYVLITYAGSTPGMEMAQIRLSCFDGESPAKPRRRGRALAMMLSAISFALGYLWCLFDEDALCWHDRITHTYAIRGARGSLFATIGACISGLFPELLRS